MVIRTTCKNADHFTNDTENYTMMTSLRSGDREFVLISRGFLPFMAVLTANGSCLLSKPGRKRSSELLSCGSFAENIPFVKPSFGLPAVDNTGGDS